MTLRVPKSVWRHPLNGSVISCKDLGIMFDEHLKFHSHKTEVSAKANRVLGMIKRSFEHLDMYCMWYQDALPP